MMRVTAQPRELYSFPPRVVPGEVGIEVLDVETGAGRPYAEDETVGLGTQAVMHAELWGFPDTTGWWSAPPERSSCTELRAARAGNVGFNPHVRGRARPRS
jgi:hypothetical protein